MSSPSSTAYLPQAVAAHPHGHARALALPALGVVFGDIDTSPLYTLKVVLGATGSHTADRVIVLGKLSLILWTLTIGNFRSGGGDRAAGRNLGSCFAFPSCRAVILDTRWDCALIVSTKLT